MDKIYDSLDEPLASGNEGVASWCPCWLELQGHQETSEKIIQHNRNIYWCRFDGCCYGLRFRDIPILKRWLVLTTGRELWMALSKRCDGSHKHAECRGHAAEASAYYPSAMCKSILKAFEHAWNHDAFSLEKMAEKHLLEIDIKPSDTTSRSLSTWSSSTMPRTTTPEVMALSRRKLSLDTAPTGKKLEEVKRTMLRVHRAAGHPGM